MTRNSRAREFSFREMRDQPAAVHASRLENFSCENQKRAHTAPHLVPSGGAYASSPTRDEDAVDARGAATKACGARTAKARGPVPPTLGSSLRTSPGAMAANKPGAPERARSSRKPLRREGRSCRLPCTVLWAFFFQPTRPAGAASARSSLRPPASSEGRVRHHPGEPRRGTAKSRLVAPHPSRRTLTRAPQDEVRAGGTKVKPHGEEHGDAVRLEP